MFSEQVFAERIIKFLIVIVIFPILVIVMQLFQNSLSGNLQKENYNILFKTEISETIDSVRGSRSIWESFELENTSGRFQMPNYIVVGDSALRFYEIAKKGDKIVKDKNSDFFYLLTKNEVYRVNFFN